MENKFVVITMVKNNGNLFIKFILRHVSEPITILITFFSPL